MSVRSRALLKQIPALGFVTYLFFLSLAFMGGGMKASFKKPVKHFLDENAAQFTELVSFVIGILFTSVVQSSSTVTSMVVELASGDVVPLVIAIGLVHGANLGTSVTSSLVAFAAETRPGTVPGIDEEFPVLGWVPPRVLRPVFYLVVGLWRMMFQPRLPGFHRAVSTAVVHGMFNAILVTLIILTLEIPFGVIHKVSEGIASTMTEAVSSSATVVEALKVVTPGAWTKPVAKWLLGLGIPGWVLVILGFVLLFVCLKEFSSRMRKVLLAGTDPDDVEAIGRTMIGTRPWDTFLRGFGLTVLVQSSSATTSMVVPLAGMGFFSVRQIFPFVMGANIGTTATALMAATAAFGEEGFHVGMTIALSHLLLNTVAVILVAIVPGLYTSVIGCTEFLADVSARVPAALLLYLALLAVVLPAVVYFLPTIAAAVLLGGCVVVMLVGPHIYLRRKGTTVEALVGN